MNVNKVLEFIGSKWFVLVLAIAMIAVLPTTYGNFMVVYHAGEMARLWWVPTVFIINLLTAVMAIYKATGMFLKKKSAPQEDWED